MIPVVDRVPEDIFRRPNPMELHTIDAYVPPDINENDGMYQFMDNYNEWDESPNTLSVNDMGSYHSFTAVNTSDSTNESIKSDFRISECQS